MNGFWCAWVDFGKGEFVRAAGRSFDDIVKEVAMYDGSAPCKFRIEWVAEEDAEAAGLPVRILEICDAHEWAYHQ